jgi:Pyruvate/2-oxoacid:ferredoxin oxidoreductase delta subunit
MSLRALFKPEVTRHNLLATGQVVPDPTRCVQCGICSFNCPIDIDVRSYAWKGENIINARCITCGECVNRCPRDALRFEQNNIFVEGAS